MYIPLYNKSYYSLLSSMLSIDDLVSFVVHHKISGMALTDDSMYGVMEFIKKCREHDIKPIIGLTVSLEEFVVVLYCKNYQGYQNLIKLSTIQNERVVTVNDLEQYSSDVICVLPFESRSHYSFCQNIYSDLYLGYRSKNEEREALLETKNVVFFPLNLYLYKIDSDYLGYLYRIREGKTVSDEVEYDLLNHELEIPNLLDYTDNLGLINTLKISDLCNLEFPKVELLLPIYECSDPSKYLFELAKAGLSRRLQGNISDAYKNRLSYELKIIDSMGFSNYFLVVYDFIKYAKQHDILVGPGRGSAAGSLVSYCLGITEIDPLKYDLLFERFLNPERKTMPDIDTDFPDDKRDEVIDYVVSKYGKKRVAGIVTFGTLGAKQVIRDVSRVLNIPTYKVDSLSKFIPSFTKDKLEDFYKNNSNFKARIDSDLLLSKMFHIACRLEGFPRHTSSHAAGIVMCQKDLDEVLPLTISEGMYLTSYSMEYLEELGLLKMDFLGLKNLTIIHNILKDIETSLGEKVNFNQIPLDDPAALHIFEVANTSGIFQFESTGMRNFLRNLRPNQFEDIFAAIALFRPGPAVNIDSYIRRKHGEEEITYLDPCLEPILKNTYGIIIYQEQIMQVANRFAGYSLGEADILRRAMSKKKVDLLKNEEEKFIHKSLERGHSYEVSKKIFDLILNFAGYGFNRSHSVAYSIIAYKMAYLKSHYQTIFFANLLTNVIGSETKTHEYIMEARANHLEILKPSINLSDIRYIVKDGKIVYPISNIKSIGVVVANSIIKARSEGEFVSIYDAFSRLYIAGVGKKNLETIIYADCFHDFSYNRATLIYNLDSLFNYAELTKDIDPSLVMQPDIEEKKEYEASFLLEKEKEVFGFYLSSHPTTMYKKDHPYTILINQIPNNFAKSIDTLILVDKIKVINTKKGDKMAFITGSDETGTMDFTLFPRVYRLYENIEKGDLLKIRGTVEKRLDQFQVVVQKVKFLNEKEDVYEKKD